MNELVIKSERGNPVTNSLLVAQKFRKQHKHVLTSIRDIISSAENSAQFFYLTTYKDSTGRSNEMYVMNRDGFSLLVMGFTGAQALKFKLEFIYAFNQMEKQLKAQIPQSFAQALRLAAEQQEQLELKEAQIKEMEPKALFADSVNASSNSILVADLAKLLKQNGFNLGQNRLFDWLRKNGYLGTKGEYYNRPTQKAMEMGLFEIVERSLENRRDNTVFTAFTVKVTGKGQIYFVNKFLKQKAA
jgi:anti-repressor protein